MGKRVYINDELEKAIKSLNYPLRLAKFVTQAVTEKIERSKQNSKNKGG